MMTSGHVCPAGLLFARVFRAEGQPFCMVGFRMEDNYEKTDGTDLIDADAAGSGLWRTAGGFIEDCIVFSRGVCRTACVGCSQPDGCDEVDCGKL